VRPLAITITAREQAELLPADPLPELAPKQVRGHTLCTVVSPGTELAANYRGENFPSHPGYAAVFRVEERGAEVESISPGDVLFCMGNHQSLQQKDASEVVTVPKMVPAHHAPIARLMGVSMTTLMTTEARPGDPVLVTGAGPIGYLAAHMFDHAGYEVHVVEPNDSRRENLHRSGIRTAYPSTPLEAPLCGEVALVVDCSGHEQAVIDGVRMVRKGGEVVLVGVPWQRRTDRFAHELLTEVFHRYAVLRSGWEWELPMSEEDFRPHSIFRNFRLALRWLARGIIPLDGPIKLNDPADAQSVYQSLLHEPGREIFQVFDWTDTTEE
jgi:threonine dehydrogenase-like Zn-dependent dehydrogenase